MKISAGCREVSVSLVGVNEIAFKRAMESVWHLKVKDTLVKSVVCHGVHHLQSCFSIRPFAL
jgi:hypothetical protein